MMLKHKILNPVYFNVLKKTVGASNFLWSFNNQDEFSHTLMREGSSHSNFGDLFFPATVQILSELNVDPDHTLIRESKVFMITPNHSNKQFEFDESVNTAFFSFSDLNIVIDEMQNTLQPNDLLISQEKKYQFGEHTNYGFILSIKYLTFA